MAAEQVITGEIVLIFGSLEVMGFGDSHPTAEEVLSDYNVSLDISTVFTFLAVATGTVITATIIPMLYILRLNPRKIMM